MGAKLEDAALGLGSGVAGQVLGLALGGIQRKAQLNQQQKLTDMQTKANQQQADYSHKLALDMWDKTNYDAQVKQMNKAGLNVGLMYGGGGAGGGTTTNAGQAGSVGSAVAEAPSAGSQIGLQLGAQMALMKAQKENIEADTANKKAGIEGTMAGAEKAKAETKGINIDTSVKENTQDATEKSIISRAEQEFQKIQQETNKAVIGTETQQSEITRIKNEAIGSYLENVLTKAKTSQSYAETKRIEEDIKQKWQALEQGLVGLGQQQQRIEIDKFANEIRANYPSIWNVGGKSFNDFVQALNRSIGGEEVKTHKIK